jgi:hypothetical protein
LEGAKKSGTRGLCPPQRGSPRAYPKPNLDQDHQEEQVEILEIKIVPPIPCESRQTRSQRRAEEEEILDEETLRPSREEEMHTGEEETFRHGKEFSNCKEVHPRQSLSFKTAPDLALQTAPPIRARPKLKAKRHADPPPKKRKRVFQEILLEPVVNAAVLDDFR